jgi:DNA-binding NtrC family response regulator
VVERAVVVAEDTVLDVSDLPEDVWCENPASSAESPRGEVNELSRSRHAAEMHRLVSALQRHQNNRCRAAKELKVSRVTLYRKMHQYGLI